MIVTLTSSRGGGPTYVVCPRAPATVDGLRAEMLALARVRDGSYAHGLVADLHAAIFLRSLDLKDDYATFFAVEYPTFAEYLRRRARLAGGAVDALDAAYAESAGMYLFQSTFAFLDAGSGLPLLCALLGEPEPADVTGEGVEDDAWD